MKCRVCRNSYGLIFCCDQCKFNVDARCALATLPPRKELCIGQEDESNATIKHFAHDHPLTSSHANMVPRIKCRACRRNLSGDIYGCYDCFFFLHRQCVEAPREIRQHPSHIQHYLTLVVDSERWECPLCTESYELGYRCDECQFNLDIDCALLILALEDQREENGSVIDRPFHEHPLSSFHVKREDENVKCKACWVEVSGEAYGCSKCLYFLHKSCAQLPTEIKHPLHDKHPLTLNPDNYSFTCKHCISERRGFSFSCKTCFFDLDIECALQYHPEQADDPVMKLSTHDHPLKDIYVTKPGERCKLCWRSINGEAYQCSNMDCKFRFHKSCAETPTEIQQAYHPQHLLTLFTQSGTSNYFCNACKYGGGLGYLFGCGKCNFYLHFRCAMRKPTLRHYLHEHSLSYFEDVRLSYHCNFCGHSCKIDFYRCTLCDFNIHRDCTLLLPMTYKHRHIHPLTLHHAICDDEFGEYFCDICEKERNPDRGVYYCEECNYVAHIECVIPVANPGSNIISGKKEILPNIDKSIATIKEKIKEREIKLGELKKELEELNTELEEAEQKRAIVLALEF